MMAERPEPTEFVYHIIELYKSESLGSGSYGGVCKAKCDGLLCAAKIMHPTLFDLRDPGTASYLSKFREECHLLSLARHPNIVQYLGTSTDPDTQLPVLLMELCEESLTAFLERSLGPISYHVQVDICHDIALALVYLHSNGLIHRDLTGNNVLMVAGPRAKITDFGMSKLANINPRMTALTLCPGNVLYMSPEALDEAKSYTTKLDVFSFGVIAIQILTRQFPNPTNRFRSVLSSDKREDEESEDEDDETSEIHREVREVVPEIERRKSSLMLIPDTHILKPVILQCLKKKERRRPSALELSQRLFELKKSSHYRGSSCGEECKQCTQRQERISDLKRLLEDKDRELKESSQQLQSKNREYQIAMQEKEDQLLHNEREMHALQRQHHVAILEKESVIACRNQALELKEIEVSECQKSLQQHQVSIQEKVSIIVSKDQVLEFKERELQASEQLVSECQQSIKQKDMAIAALQQTICAHKREIQQLEQQDTAHRDTQHQKTVNIIQGQHRAAIREKESVIASRNQVLEGQKRELQASEHLVSEFQQSIQQKDRTIADLQKTISAHERKIQQLEQIARREKPHQSIVTIPQKKEASGDGRDISKMKWRRGKNSPEPMRRGRAVVHGNTAYFRPYGSVKVYSYQNIHGEERWSQLPDNRYKDSGLVVIDGFLTSVGGYNDCFTNILRGLKGEGERKKWSKIFPPMPTSRSNVACVTTGEILIVAGGERGLLSEWCDTVEVMNTNTKQWTTISPLPIKSYDLSATVYGDKLYLAAGVTEGLSKSVFTCSVMDLLPPVSLASKLRQTFSPRAVWSEISELPVKYSTLVSFGDDLLAIGGRDDSYTPSSTVYRYDSHTDSWTGICHMMKERSWCFAFSFPEHHLTVVGGLTEKFNILTESVEICMKLE